MSDDAEAAAYRRALASNPVYAQRPALTAAMAGTNATSQDLSAVGGFVQALDMERAVNLASQSGATLNMSGRERSLAGTFGARVSSVQSNAPYQPLNLQLAPEIVPVAAAGGVTGGAEELSWWQSAFSNVADAAGDVADFLLTNPVSETIFDGFEWAMNGVKAVYRGVSSGINQDNDAEVRRQMLRRGYDPSSAADNIAFFWNQGENLYGDLSDMRRRYGDEKIDQMQDYLSDPAAYFDGLNDPSKTAEENARRQQEMQTPEWEALKQELDARHISPGRDFADGIGLDFNESGYTAVSGVVDAVATVMFDPTLMAGSAIKAARVARDGIDLAHDSRSIHRVLGIDDEVSALETTLRGRIAAPIVAGARNAASTLTGGAVAGANPVREGVLRFLSDAPQYQAALDAGDDLLAASIHAAMTQRHRNLMPLLGEVLGKRVTLSTDANFTVAKASRREVTHAADPASLDVFAPAAKGTSVTANSEKIVGQIRSGKGHNQSKEWNITDAKPIETIEEFADYLGATQGLLRIANGFAAQKQLMMPGRISWAAERRARRAGARAGRTGNTGDVFTYGKDSASQVPDESDKIIQEMADAHKTYNKDFIHASILSLRRWRAKGEKLNRRVSSHLVRGTELDMSNPQHVTEIRNLARYYLPKREADRIAMLWERGNLAQRRNITHGLVQSTMHAAGLGRSKAGKEFMDKWTADRAELAQRRYGLGGTDLLSSEAGTRNVALYPNQLKDTVVIPPFAALQHMAAKGTFAGHNPLSFMQSLKLDRTMNVVRMGWLVNPATGFRNVIDEFAGLAATGHTGDLVRGRALHTKATAEARKASGEARVTAAAEKGWRYRIFPAMRKGSDSVNDVMFGSLLGKYYSSPLRWGQEITDQQVKWVQELNDLEKSEFMSSVVTSGTASLDESGRAAGEAMAREGILARKMTYAGHKEIEIDGGAGLNAWANNLGIKFSADSPARVALSHIAKSSDARSAVNDVEQFVRSPAGERFLREAEIANFDANGKRIVDEAARDAVIRDYAQRIVKDVGLTVMGRDGALNEKLVERLLRNDPPDRQWLAKHVPAGSRPEHAVAPDFVPDIQSPANKMIEGYAHYLAIGYDWTVVKPTQAITRNSALSSMYVRAREQTVPFENLLIGKGWSPEAAQKQAAQVALQHTEISIARHIDDPSMRSQMTVVIRNFSNFQRAQEDWLRRWGRNLRDDPTLLRKGQLALEAGTNVGVVDRDEDGNLTFSYPGSGAALTAIGKVFNLFGQPDSVLAPVADLSSKLTFLSPSLDNPIGFSASPIVATPFKLFAGLFPEAQLGVAAADKLLNGPMGAGHLGVESVFESMLPKVFDRIYQITQTDPLSPTAAAERQAMVQLEAAGMVPDKATASPAELEKFKHQLHVTAMNMMASRAVFSLFAPAAPGLPDVDVDGQEADWAFHEQGLNTLKEEYHVMVAKLGIQKANETWTITHPNELVYTQSSATEIDAKGAYAEPTLGAAKWIQDNLDFMKDYKGVSSYFIPETGGAFSSVGWASQLETGVRAYKSTSDFVDGIIIRRGESAYYTLKDQYDAAIATAVADKNVDEQAALEDEWSMVKDNMKNFNPLMAEKMAAFGVGVAGRGPAQQQLRDALSDPAAVAALGQANAQSVALLLNLQSRYEQEHAAIGGDQSVAARAYSSSLRAATKAAMEQVVAQNPQIADLYNAQFRMND